MIYADDILLFSRSTVVLQEFITTLQRTANEYNMQLNMEKTVLLHMNNPSPSPIYFFTPDSPNTNRIKTQNSTKYLGIKVNNKGTLHSHLGPKLSNTRKSFNTLQRLWSHTSIETKFTLKIFSGIFPAMVLYALHHDWHLDSTLNKIDAWHCRLLRRTIKVKTTYIDKTKPNRWVYKQTRSEKLSDKIGRFQIKYFAHVARNPDDIIHKVCFGPHATTRSLNATRRKGRPRHHWTPHIEHLTTTRLRAAGKNFSNRAQLFKVCADRKFIRKCTNEKILPWEAQHAGESPPGGS